MKICRCLRQVFFYVQKNQQQLQSCIAGIESLVTKIRGQILGYPQKTPKIASLDIDWVDGDAGAFIVKAARTAESLASCSHGHISFALVGAAELAVLQQDIRLWKDTWSLAGKRNRAAGSAQTVLAQSD